MRARLCENVLAFFEYMFVVRVCSTLWAVPRVQAKHANWVYIHLLNRSRRECPSIYMKHTQSRAHNGYNKKTIESNAML